MKFFNRTWKLGVSLFLCFCLLSMTVFASEQPIQTDPYEETEFDDPTAEPVEEDVPQNEDEEETDPETEEEEKDTADPETEEEEEKDTADEVSGEKEETENTKKTETAPKAAVEARAAVRPGTVVKSGDCGYVLGTMFYTVTYLGKGQYKLTISGTGKMLLIAVNYGAPWKNYSADITEIEIREGVEGIREYAFNGCDKVTSLTIPASVSYIEKGSFKMGGLKDVYFLGPYYEKFNVNAFSGTTGVTVHHRQDLNWNGFTFTGTTSGEGELSLQKNEAKPATCTEDGNIEYYYSEAWNKYFSDAEGTKEITDLKEVVIPAPGHDWDEGVRTQEPTATEEGLKTYSCSRCSEIRTEPILAAAETEPGTVVKRGECGAEPGTLFYEIRSLGNGRSGEDRFELILSGNGRMQTFSDPLDAPWHMYSDGLARIEIRDGIKSVTANAFNDCDHVAALTIPASVTAINPGAFSMRGLKNVYFLGSFSEDISPDAFRGDDDLKIQYNEKNETWRDVSFSNGTIQGIDLSLKPVEGKPAACTDEGNKPYYYSEVWGKYFSDAEGTKEITDLKEVVIPAQGHDWNEGVVTTEATAASEGVITYTCLRCDEIRTEAVPVLSEDGTPAEGASDDSTPADSTPDAGKPGADKPGAGKPAGSIQDEDAADDEIQGPDEGGDFLFNINLTPEEQSKGAQEGQTQAAPSFAGSVKTADENNQILYLVLLLISFGVIILVIQRRINR